MKITVVAGARPNFIKIAPILKAFNDYNIDFRLVHTGQHYDKNLSDSFFADLEIPNPDVNFNIGSGSQAEQTGNIMIAFEKDLRANPSDYVLVVGDVNSSMACGIVSKKENIPLIHVEAGLRSRDETMPEEINRLLVDSISDLLFTTTQDASNILLHEGVAPHKIHFVGNVMIDSLVNSLERLKKPDHLDLPARYFILTLHRPSNVDEANKTKLILEQISETVGEAAKVIFPIHPRTLKSLKGYQFPDNIITTAPIRYLEFMYLIKNSIGVITDSGGIQEETTYLRVPCITLRNNTERPETITIGTNELIGDNHDRLKEAIKEIVDQKWKSGKIPELWDGNAARRIADILTAANG